MDTNTLTIINLIGFSTMLVGFLYIGRKLQILDDLKRAVDRIDHNLRVVTNHLIKHDGNFDYAKLK